jgi:hypothetical protein
LITSLIARKGGLGKTEDCVFLLRDAQSTLLSAPPAALSENAEPEESGSIAHFRRSTQYQMFIHMIQGYAKSQGG